MAHKNVFKNYKLMKVKVLRLMALSIVIAGYLPSASAQSIILVNGQPVEVILDGESIESIVDDQVDTYLDQYDQAPNEAFSQGELILVEEKNTVGTTDPEVTSKQNWVSQAGLRADKNNSPQKVRVEK